MQESTIAERNHQKKILLQNILYLTDFSDAAKAALPVASALTKRFGGQMTALHILTPGDFCCTTPELYNEIAEGQREYARAAMRKLDASLEQTVHRVRVCEGDSLPEVLEQEIKTEHPDLIVVGTHGRRGVRRALLGSVAERVFRSAAVPVLTVGPSAKRDARECGQFERILYATDFTPASIGGAPWAFFLAEEYAAELTLMHVIRKLRKEEMLGELSVADAMHQLGSLAPVNFSGRPDCVAAYGEPGPTILEEARVRGADLIVLGVRHTNHAGLTAHAGETTGHQLVAQAPCPVLTVRGPWPLVH